MTRTYLVQMPRAEARHLAGTSPAWPATPEARCVAALREWLHGVSRRRSATMPTAKIMTDLTAILSLVPLTTRPLRGPFGPGGGGLPPPGHAEYLGDGIVRLDEEAIATLAALAPGEDFRVTCTGAGLTLTIGTDHYLAREEDKPPR